MCLCGFKAEDALGYGVGGIYFDLSTHVFFFGFSLRSLIFV